VDCGERLLAFALVPNLGCRGNRTLKREDRVIELPRVDCPAAFRYRPGDINGGLR
jgi:hypothetical protein